MADAVNLSWRKVNKGKEGEDKGERRAEWEERFSVACREFSKNMVPVTEAIPKFLRRYWGIFLLIFCTIQESTWIYCSIKEGVGRESRFWIWNRIVSIWIPSLVKEIEGDEWICVLEFAADIQQEVNGLCPKTTRQRFICLWILRGNQSSPVETYIFWQAAKWDISWLLSFIDYSSCYISTIPSTRRTSTILSW